MHLSFELCPPKTPEDTAGIVEMADGLNQQHPAYFAVSTGPHHAIAPISFLQRLVEKGFTVVPHLAARHFTHQSLQVTLSELKNLNIQRIIALRGESAQKKENHFHTAVELVKKIREISGDQFYLTVTAYPERHPDSHNAETDMTVLQHKIVAGANQILTQYCYNIHAYQRFLENCEAAKITIPILPGVLPVTDLDLVLRLANQHQVSVPTAFRQADQRVREQALQGYCQQLLKLGAPGYHVFTLNSRKFILTF